MSEPEIVVTYPEGLPVSQRRDDIIDALRGNQVVIIAGATGSGKTTQLPKMLLELGKTSIGHTQPRRIAARTIAERIAEELGQQVGELVGYQVRFTDRVGKNTRIKLMTDGILLNEIHRDRDLKKYDAIIIDEAHERSLTVDFLIGYLRQLLPRRPDLTVVITSATIDPESFAKHFASADGTPAPIIEVSGRTFPVEIRYRPLVAEALDAESLDA
jgi:ATP-dependent helicase HrpA